MDNLESAFEHLVKDMYDSEKRLLDAMAQLRDAASDEKLKKAIEDHIQQSKQQVIRLEEIAAKGNFKPTGETCAATIGLVKEAQMHLDEFKGTPAADAVIIAALQKCEHYEIANYGTAATWAKELGKDDALKLLLETLKEEEKADELLTKIAKKSVNEEAMEGGESKSQGSGHKSGSHATATK